MDVKDLKWYVYEHDFNDKKIKPFNIFNHGRFREDVEKFLKKYKDKDEFAQKLKSSLIYYFWCKSEWEVVITSWAPYITMPELDRLNVEREKAIKEHNREPYRLYVNPDVAEKIDVYDQVMNNWDVFLEYVWNSKIHRPRKKKMIEVDDNRIYLETLELEKAIMGRGIDYETAEQILSDFQKRMDRF